MARKQPICERGGLFCAILLHSWLAGLVSHCVPCHYGWELNIVLLLFWWASVEFLSKMSFYKQEGGRQREGTSRPLRTDSAYPAPGGPRSSSLGSLPALSFREISCVWGRTRIIVKSEGSSGECRSRPSVPSGARDEVQPLGWDQLWRGEGVCCLLSCC